MVTVRRTTPLPISADAAFALAQKPATFAYVARGVLRVPALEGLEGPAGALAVPGARVSGRLWWLGVVPSWTHHLEVVAVEPERWELRTKERGGPIRRWDHRLTFAPAQEAPAEEAPTAADEAPAPAQEAPASAAVEAPAGEAAAKAAAAGCLYTDEIVIDAGPLTLPTALFARVFFALRQARWRRLAAVLS